MAKITVLKTTTTDDGATTVPIHTRREHSGGFALNTTRVELNQSHTQLTLVADPADRGWDSMPYPYQEKAFKDLVSREARKRGWRIYFPEISARMILLGFHNPVPETADDAFAFVFGLGFTNDPPATKRKPQQRKS